MQVVVYGENDGVSVVTPVDGISLEQAMNLSIPPGAKYIITDTSQLPDDYFRDAWVMSTDLRVSIDKEKAKGIQRDLWRQARLKRLKDLDFRFMLALERGNEKEIEDIKLLKQKLRDVTKTQLPDEVEAIKNVWPNILNDDYAD